MEKTMVEKIEEKAVELATKHYGEKVSPTIKAMFIEAICAGADMAFVKVREMSRGLLQR